MTSVRELSSTDNLLALRSMGSSLAVKSESDETVTLVLYSIEGRELLHTSLNGRGLHSVDISQLRTGAYLATVYSATSRASSLIVR